MQTDLALSCPEPDSTRAGRRPVLDTAHAVLRRAWGQGLSQKTFIEEKDMYAANYLNDFARGPKQISV